MRKPFFSFSVSRLRSRRCLTCSNPAVKAFLVRRETSSPMSIRMWSTFCHSSCRAKSEPNLEVASGNVNRLGELAPVVKVPQNLPVLVAVIYDKEFAASMVRAEGVEPSRAFAGPTDFHTTSAFAAAALAFVVWTIPSPSGAFRRRCCPSSLYTFPADAVPSGLGSGSPFQGFPDFEQFCIAGFPGEHSSFPLSPLRLPVPPRPRGRSSAAVHDRATAGIAAQISSSGAGFAVLAGFFFFLGLMMLTAAASIWFLMCAA